MNLNSNYLSIDINSDKTKKMMDSLLIDDSEIDDDEQDNNEFEIKI